MSPAIAPDLIRQSLSGLDTEQLLAPPMAAYQAFYGLDLPQLAHLERRAGCLHVHGYDIVTQLWAPPEPVGTLIVLHGYYDHMGLYRHVVAWGVSMGLAVLGCDLPGHGLSSGPRASINEFAEYQAVLDALLAEARRLALPQPWHLLGQSTGGAILIDHLLHREYGEELGQSILLAPLVRPRAWGRSRLSYWLLRPFVQQIARQFTANSGDEEFLRFVQDLDPLQPDILPTAWVGALDRWIQRIENAQPIQRAPLIVQGEQDMTVDWRHNLPLLQAKFGDAQILRLPDARHHLANEREELRQRYFDFLRERLQ